MLLTPVWFPVRFTIIGQAWRKRWNLMSAISGFESPASLHVDDISKTNIKTWVEPVDDTELHMNFERFSFRGWLLSQLGCICSCFMVPLLNFGV